MTRLSLFPLMMSLSALPAGAEMPEPYSQERLNALVATDPAEAFIDAFEAGDELTEAAFTKARGVGANVGAGNAFTRLPRADLAGSEEWANHFPKREGGPQAQACITCHAVPLANGAGGIALNVAVDPLHTGDPSKFLERNTLHLFGLGAVQRLAEEITTDLQMQRYLAIAEACDVRQPITTDIGSKGISYGSLTVTPEPRGSCRPQIDLSSLDGIDDDLVVRMFGWKGTEATLRGFTRGAAHNEMGLQAVELVGAEDGDYDGVINELTIGDLTALTTYMAGLERPVSKLELARYGQISLSDEETNAILAGEAGFEEIGCASCHMPVLELRDARFTEPSVTPGFREMTLPSGENSRDMGLSYASAVSFDLGADQPNNRVETSKGEDVHLGAFERTDEGTTLVRWYSDFKRHDMGPGLSDPIDAFGFGASVWPTRSLAGVGSTGPWLHNGNATSLAEAILAHGGDAKSSRDAFAALPETTQDEIIAFLENLVIVSLDPEGDH